VCLSELVEPDGATVAAEQVIARIDTSGGAVAAAPKAAADKARPEPAKAEAAAPAKAQAAAPAAGGIAMPAAAKMMADNKIAASGVAGTGKDGRITKGDVFAAMARPAPASGAGGAGRAGVPRRCCPRCRRPSPTWASAPSSACR
jgi:2-oxoglutarate dehydrogenase E2 component (dihydrolipoamide succinyltransferase)